MAKSGSAKPLAELHLSWRLCLLRTSQRSGKSRHFSARRYVILNVAQRSEESSTAVPTPKTMRFLAPLGMTMDALLIVCKRHNRA